MAKPVEEKEEYESFTVIFSFWNPCFLLQNIIRACARCLGFSGAPSPPVPKVEPSKMENIKPNSTEDKTIVQKAMASRRPQKPRVSEGGKRGGQINIITTGSTTASRQ